MTETTYNPATCVTAGELRAAGIPIRDSVPDCGWIRRGAMRVKFTTPTGTRDEIAADILSLDVEVEFTEPFHWIEINVVSSKK